VWRDTKDEDRWASKRKRRGQRLWRCGAEVTIPCGMGRQWTCARERGRSEWIGGGSRQVTCGTEMRCKRIFKNLS
jgi:hypothetical protein